MADPLADLTARWRSDADVLDRYGRDGEADRLRERADEVDDALQRWWNERLTIAQAAEASGYSAKHLRRLVRNERLPATRPEGEDRILVRRKHLPRKPASGDDDGPNPVAEHVRKIRSS